MKTLKSFKQFQKTAVALSVAVGGALLATAALAAGAGQSEPAEVQRDCDLRLGTGPSGGVYEVMAQDILQVCGNAVSMCAVPSEGGLDNITRLSANEIDLGFAQIDTLQEMRRGGDEGSQSLQAVMPLHANLMHIITLTAGVKVPARNSMEKYLPGMAEQRQIRRFSELREMRIAVVGSAQMLGQLLEKNLNFHMEFVTAANDDQALKLLKAGQVQAIFTSGGWPMPNISRHTPTSGYSLVEYDLQPQPPYMLVKRTYKNLEAYNLGFLSAPNLLFTRGFKPGGAASKKVGILQTCLINHLDELQEGRHHRAWAEVKSPTDTLGIARFTGRASAKP
jgi:hypothetical protein